MGLTSYSVSTFQNPKSTGILLAQLSQNISNITTGIASYGFLPSPYPIITEVRNVTNAFLWHPTTFLLNIIISVWGLIIQTPPTLKLLFACFIIHRLYSWITQDYQAYLDLGRGGTPSDVWGWWRVTRLKFMANVDVLEPPHVPPMLEPYRGLLWHLPQRSGVRPLIKGVAPQRQIDQKTPPSTFNTLVNMIKTVAKANPDNLQVDTSTLERHTLSLKAKRPGPIELPNTEGEFGHEICHPHRNDGSVHMIMHPEDIKTVMEAGWGQRHPLSTSAWYWKLWYHHIRQKRVPVPEFLVLIYAPRNDEEVAVVEKLLQAAIWFKMKKVPKGNLAKLVAKTVTAKARGRKMSA